MITSLKKYIAIEKKPHRGLMPLEKVVLGYALFTLLMVLFTYTKLESPEALIWGRVRLCFITLAVWAIYEMVPCRVTRFLRILVQGVMLAIWYPDTYELNRVLPNLDHYFAEADQMLFGCQPALLFSQHYPSHLVSELMDLGYASYYPLIVLTILIYFFGQYKDFERAAWIIFASFFTYYIIYDVLPVAGPTFYYKAVGLKHIMAGTFPSLGDYFNSHQDCLPAPGYTDGIFYHLVEDAKAAGERPTAAFPSSHVGVSTLCLLLVIYTRRWRWLLLFVPLYVLLCLSTVYIQAHYLVDALAGLITGVLFFFVGIMLTKKMKGCRLSE